MENITEADVKQVPSGSPHDDGLRLVLNWFVRHGDTEMAPAAANILSRWDGSKGPNQDPVDISAPAKVVQEYVGHGQYMGVELKKEDDPQKNLDKVLAQDVTQNVPQVGGQTPIGRTKTGTTANEDQVSVQPTSQTTAAPAEAPAAKK